MQTEAFARADHLKVVNMTIKITRTGRRMPSTYVGSCHKCGCEIECAKEDIVYEDRPCADGYIKCPNLTCDAHIVPVLTKEQP